MSETPLYSQHYNLVNGIPPTTSSEQKAYGYPQQFQKSNLPPSNGISTPSSLSSRDSSPLPKNSEFGNLSTQIPASQLPPSMQSRSTLLNSTPPPVGVNKGMQNILLAQPSEPSAKNILLAPTLNANTPSLINNSPQLSNPKVQLFSPLPTSKSTNPSYNPPNPIISTGQASGHQNSFNSGFNSTKPPTSKTTVSNLSTNSVLSTVPLHSGSNATNSEIESERFSPINLGEFKSQPLSAVTDLLSNTLNANQSKNERLNPVTSQSSPISNSPHPPNAGNVQMRPPFVNTTSQIASLNGPPKNSESNQSFSLAPSNLQRQIPTTQNNDLELKGVSDLVPNLSQQISFNQTSSTLAHTEKSESLASSRFDSITLSSSLPPPPATTNLLGQVSVSNTEGHEARNQGFKPVSLPPPPMTTSFSDQISTANIEVNQTGNQGFKPFSTPPTSKNIHQTTFSPLFPPPNSSQTHPSIQMQGLAQQNIRASEPPKTVPQQFQLNSVSTANVNFSPESQQQSSSFQENRLFNSSPQMGQQQIPLDPVSSLHANTVKQQQPGLLQQGPITQQQSNLLQQNRTLSSSPQIELQPVSLDPVSKPSENIVRQQQPGLLQQGPVTQQQPNLLQQNRTLNSSPQMRQPQGPLDPVSNSSGNTVRQQQTGLIQQGPVTQQPNLLQQNRTLNSSPQMRQPQGPLDPVSNSSGNTVRQQQTGLLQQGPVTQQQPNLFQQNRTLNSSPQMGQQQIPLNPVPMKQQQPVLLQQSHASQQQSHLLQQTKVLNSSQKGQQQMPMNPVSNASANPMRQQQPGLLQQGPITQPHLFPQNKVLNSSQQIGQQQFQLNPVSTIQANRNSPKLAEPLTQMPLSTSQRPPVGNFPSSQMPQPNLKQPPLQNFFPSQPNQATPKLADQNANPQLGGPIPGNGNSNVLKSQNLLDNKSVPPSIYGNMPPTGVANPLYPPQPSSIQNKMTSNQNSPMGRRYPSQPAYQQPPIQQQSIGQPQLPPMMGQKPLVQQRLIGSSQPPLPQPASQSPMISQQSPMPNQNYPPTQQNFQNVDYRQQQIGGQAPVGQYQQNSYQNSNLNQQFGNLNVTQTGFNRLWGGENFDLLQVRNILPLEKIEAPPVRLKPETLDTANCHPDIFRCTMTKIPENSSLLNKSRLPLGVLIHPFRDLNHLPVIQCSTIVRCRACRTYINPFVYFVDTKRWKCNLCYRVNELPEEFQYDPVSKSYGDPSRRPEIKSSTIEYIAPSEYMLRPPQPAIYLFLLDISSLAIESGYLKLLCDILIEELDNLPGDSRTQIGFLCYNSSLHFYSLGEGLSQPHEMTIVDIDDVFLPSPDNLLVNLKERKELVKDLLIQLPTRFIGTHDNNSALGAALQVALKMMSPTGGRVSVFQCTLPTVGPGNLTAREVPSNRASADVQHLNPATDFYKRLALDCSAHQVAVDLFILNSQYIDLSTISGISRFSAGCIHHWPLFKANRILQAQQFENCLRRYLTRKIGYEAVMRIRCTRGLSIHTFHGNFFVRSTDLLSLPNCNPDAGFGMQVAIEESLSDLQQVCFQAALLYTSSKGERRIRVHTLCLPIANTLTDVLNSADQQCIVGLVAKMAVDRSFQSSLSDARDAFINVVVDVLSAYKLSLNQGSGTNTGLLAPESLKLLPMYIVALLKYVAFRTGTSTRLDDRVFSMCEMKSLPLFQLIQEIYADMYPIHCLTDEGGVSTEEGNIIPQPPRLQLSAEKLDARGAFIIDCGHHQMIYVGHAISNEFLNNTLGFPHFAAIPDECYEIPKIGTPDNDRLHIFISSLNDEKPYPATIQIIRDNSPLKNMFLEKLIEDRIESALSYYEFLQHLKSHVK